MYCDQTQKKTIGQRVLAVCVMTRTSLPTSGTGSAGAWHVLAALLTHPASARPCLNLQTKQAERQAGIQWCFVPRSIKENMSKLYKEREQ